MNSKHLITFMAGLMVTFGLILTLGQLTSTAADAVVELPKADYQKLLKGAKVNLKKDEILVVNLWATWCGPCVREFPELNKLVAAAKGKNIKFIGVTNEDAATVKEFFSNGRRVFSYEIVTNDALASSLPILYGNARGSKVPDAIPQHYVIKNGKVIFFQLGGLMEKDVPKFKAALGV